MHIKNNFETRALSVALHKMKITLNLVKHINYNINSNYEHDLNQRIEHCEEYFNDKTSIDLLSKFGVNYYTTKDIESVIDSVLNIWN